MPLNIENNMISMLFQNCILKLLTIFPDLAIYSEPLCATYASFGGGGSHITIVIFPELHFRYQYYFKDNGEYATYNIGKYPFPHREQC